MRKYNASIKHINKVFFPKHLTFFSQEILNNFVVQEYVVEHFLFNQIILMPTIETSNSILILPRHHRPPNVAQSQHTAVSKTLMINDNNTQSERLLKQILSSAVPTSKAKTQETNLFSDVFVNPSQSPIWIFLEDSRVSFLRFRKWLTATAIAILSRIRSKI